MFSDTKAVSFLDEIAASIQWFELWKFLNGLDVLLTASRESSRDYVFTFLEESPEVQRSDSLKIPYLC